jgi:4a-hydroxytetrahydrobiopterin dehydratase
MEDQPALLSDHEVDRALGPLPGWRRRGDVIERELMFRDFTEALRFVEQLAEAAVDYGRRPDICISEFNHVRLSIGNPHHAGFTLAELRLATKVDTFLAERHPDA